MEEEKIMKAAVWLLENPVEGYEAVAGYLDKAKAGGDEKTCEFWNRVFEKITELFLKHVRNEASEEEKDLAELASRRYPDIAYAAWDMEDRKTDKRELERRLREYNAGNSRQFDRLRKLFRSHDPAMKN